MEALEKKSVCATVQVTGIDGLKEMQAKIEQAISLLTEINDMDIDITFLVKTKRVKDASV